MIATRHDYERPPLSEEELNLIGVTNDELERRNRVRSFDYDQFCARTENTEKWQFIIQAHLYFDHVLSLMLHENFERPDKINLQRMSFSHKLQLIDALGLISYDLIAPISSLNAMRNKISHDLNYDVSEKAQNEFKSTLSSRIRQAIYKGDDSSANMTFELHVHYILHFAEIDRQNRAIARICLKKEHAAIRAMLLGRSDLKIAD